MIEDNLLIPLFIENEETETNDTGYESCPLSSSPKSFSAKDILCILENLDMKNMVERFLQHLFQFLCTSQFFYKYKTNSLESVKDTVLVILKYLEENDSIDHLTMICEVFIDCLWDSFEKDNDVRKFYYLKYCSCHQSKYYRLPQKRKVLQPSPIVI